MALGIKINTKMMFKSKYLHNYFKISVRGRNSITSYNANFARPFKVKLRSTY